MKSVRIRPPAPNARLAELVDALVLEASVERRASSSLAVGTRINWIDESKIVNASHRGHLVTHAGIPAMKRRGKSPHLRCA